MRRRPRWLLAATLPLGAVLALGAGLLAIPGAPGAGTGAVEAVPARSVVTPGAATPEPAAPAVPALDA
ncbi:MAG: hypothetical protein L0H64_22565, partial [Pseudonocardia sp.]|nr:hypothetical protein [Pseudonocardia sp.]